MDTLPQINNEFYDELGMRWYQDDRHPIALLRAESQCKLQYIQKIFAAENVPKNATILDIACGGGFLTNPLTAAGYQVTGVDLSAPSLAIAKQFAASDKNPHYQTADALQLPFTAQRYDVVLMMDFLEHVETPEAAIIEAVRVLKPGGIFVFHTFNRTWLSYLLAVKALEVLFRDGEKHIHLYRLLIKPQELQSMLERQHLHIKDIQGIAPKIMNRAFWQTLARRRVAPGFSFHTVSSTRLGYIGYAS